MFNTTTPQSGVICVAVCGIIGPSTFMLLEEELERCMEKKPTLIILDLSQTIWTSSVAWGLLLEVQEYFAETGGRLALVCPSPAVLESLSLMGIEDCFSFKRSVSEALEP